MITPEELLRRAARCYQESGLEDDACRCLEGAGEHRRAAGLHERNGRHEAAALAYHLAEAWHDAARCYLRCQRPADAGHCLERAGEPLQAAWVLAEAAHHFDRARALAAEAPHQTPQATVERELVLIRCEAGNGNRQKAATGLARLLPQIGERGHGTDGLRLLEWALAVANHLGRPDLAAALFAHFSRDGEVPAAVLERWEGWAAETLGDPGALPFSPDETTSEPSAAETNANPETEEESEAEPTLEP